MKKVLSLIVASILMLPGTALGVAEEKTAFEYSDHVAGQIPENLIINPASGILFATLNTSAIKKDYITDVWNGTAQSYGGYYMKALEDVTEVASFYGVRGVVFPKNGTAGINTSAGFFQNDTYVFRAAARSRNLDKEARINIGLSDGKRFLAAVCTNEYGTQGMTISADGEWNIFCGTLSFSADTQNPMLSLGFPIGVQKDSEVEFNLCYDGIPQLYFAREEVYDISVTGNPDRNVLSTNEKILYEASVTNQLGIEGTLNQKFSWYILDEEKNICNEGFELKVSSSTETAELSVRRGASGKYYLAAVADDYQIARLSAFEVQSADDFTDYVKGDMPENLIQDPSNVNLFATVNNACIGKSLAYEYKEPMGCVLKANAVIEAPIPCYGALGVAIPNVSETSDIGIDPGEGLEGQSAYVFKAAVKNVSGTGDIKINAGLSNNNYWKAGVPLEYPDGGITVEASDNWAEFCATMIMPGNKGSLYRPILSLGFAEGTAADRKVEFNLGRENVAKLYFAKEEAYDIYVKPEREGFILKGESIGFEAGVVNQIGTTGALTQQFDWYIADEDGGFVHDGTITLEIGEGTNHCTVKTTAEAKSGMYHVIAKANEYGGFVRFCDLQVCDNGSFLYVNPDGNDAADGSQASPLATIAGAKARISALRAEGKTISEVIFAPGEYRFLQTVSFSSDDDFDTTVKFKAAEDGSVIFKGSMPIDPESIYHLSDKSIADRLAPGMENKIVCIDLSEYGITADNICDVSSANGQYMLTTHGEFNSLYIDGTEQPIAQWPEPGRYATRGSKQSDNSFVYTDENCDRWSKAKNWWIAAFIPYDYSRFRFGVKTIDTENKVITIVDNPAVAITDERSKRWKAFNLIEEITLPGEYAVDRENLMLYFYPPHDINGAKIEFSVLNKQLIDIKETENITFEGITFAQTRNHAVSMTDVKNIKFINCSFRDISGDAIRATGSEYAETGYNTWQKQKKNGTYKVDIRDCDFFNIGMSAINLAGGGNIDTLTDSENVIENNLISCTAQKAFWEPVILGGCGTVVRNNNISNCPCQAIRPWGNNHLVEYNEIYNCLTEDADCGAIYWGGSMIFQGTLVRYNYIHDLESPDSRIASSRVGVYWDDCQIGQSAKYNIFANMPIDFNSNGAGATVHAYNTTVNANRTLSFLDHSLREDEVITRGVFSDSLEEERAEIVNAELFYKRYPYLEHVMNGSNPKLYTSITGNFAVGANRVGIQSQDNRFAAIEGNVQLESFDEFVDAENQDFRLRSTSEQAQNNPNLLNDANFDIEKIGLQRFVELNTETAGFDLLYPSKNAAVQYDAQGIEFSWQPAKGANSYRLVIASDNEFSDIVYEEETPYISDKVTGLSMDRTYYWKVYAVNISRELGAEWENTDGASRFTLSETEEDVTVSSIQLKKGEETKLIFDITYRTDKNKDVKVFVAAYNSYGMLIFANVNEMSAEKGRTDSIECVIPEENAVGIKCIKLFVWDKALVPLTGGNRKITA